MKKLTSLVLTLIFTASLALAVINSLTATPNPNAKNSFATICPLPPPPPPPDKKGGSSN